MQQGAMISARVLSSLLLSHLSHLCGNRLIIYLSVYLVRLYVIILCSMNGSSCVGRSLTPCRTTRTVNVSKVMSVSASSLGSSLWISWETIFLDNTLSLIFQVSLIYILRFFWSRLNTRLLIFTKPSSFISLDSIVLFLYGDIAL